MQDLALFDFDGTISRQDSFVLFMRYAGGPRFFSGCVQMAPQILAFLMKRYPNHRLKQDFVRYHFKDWPEDRLDALALRFCQDRLPAILRPKAMDRIEWHRRRGDTLVVVSACLEDILGPWCRQQALDLLATRLERQGGKITGSLASANCRGEEKVRRIRQRYDLGRFQAIHAYGDSSGDHAMLELADHPHYKPFL